MKMCVTVDGIIIIIYISTIKNMYLFGFLSKIGNVCLLSMHLIFILMVKKNLLMQIFKWTLWRLWQFI